MPADASAQTFRSLLCLRDVLVGHPWVGLGSVRKFGPMYISVGACSRKRVQLLKKRKKSCFLDFEKNVKKT